MKCQFYRNTIDRLIGKPVWLDKYLLLKKFASLAVSWMFKIGFKANCGVPKNARLIYDWNVARYHSIWHAMEGTTHHTCGHLIFPSLTLNIKPKRNNVVEARGLLLTFPCAIAFDKKLSLREFARLKVAITCQCKFRRFHNSAEWYLKLSQ